MMKKKVFDIAGSNIEMLGSAAEKKCKEAAGKFEKAWKVAGKKEGLEIWRIEKFKVVKWPTDKYGEFYTGDSYIVLKTYKKPDTDKLAFDLHFWLGTETSQDEAGTAAYKTVELDDQLGGVPVQHREVCGKESHQFLNYFQGNGGIQLFTGGVDTGFRHTEAETYEPRLLHLKGRKNVRIEQVEMEVKSLSSGDCFVLDAGLSIYQFQGKNSNKDEKFRATQYTSVLKSKRNGKPEVVVIDQEEKKYPDEFWELIGGSNDDIANIRDDDGGDEDWEKSNHRQMFQLTDAGGKLEFNLIGQSKTVTKSKLNSDDVFIVDVGHEVYVWVGKNSSKNERLSAMSKTQQYLEEYKRPSFLPVTRMNEGSESDEFLQAMTPRGIKRFKKSSGGPTMEQKGEMGCYLTFEDSSNGTLFLNWNKSNVDKHIAYFKPTKSVPLFKFKTKGGKSELTRSTNNNTKNFYEGWCNYIKLAKEYKSTFIYKDNNVKICSHGSDKKIVTVPRGVVTDLKEFQTVCALPGACKIFDGITTLDRSSFINKSQAVGAALVIGK